MGRCVVYASEGRELHALALDPHDGSLTPLARLSFAEIVQYAAIDGGRRRAYVSISDREGRHFLVALTLDGGGVPTTLGDPLAVDERVIHLCADADGRHLVVAHPLAGRLSVISLHPDGRINSIGTSAGGLGYFPHQALLDATGRGLVACVMGWDAQAGAPERPGALVAFRYGNGLLEKTSRYDFPAGQGPRHLDYAHGRVYVAVERGNRLAVFDYADGVLGARPRFDVTTLADPSAARPGQRAGAIHVHPNGRWLYVTNRGGAVNDVALFDVDERTGEPRPRGHFDSGGLEPRTFTIDPTGAFLIVANHTAGPATPRSWVVFRIEEDGALRAVRRYERSAGDLFWVGAARV